MTGLFKQSRVLWAIRSISALVIGIAAIVLLPLGMYAFVRGFGLLELTFIRQLGGITAIVSGVILALPFVRSKLK